MAAADPRAAAWAANGKDILHLGETYSFEKKLGAGRFASVYALKCRTKPALPQLAAKVTTLAGISAWARAQLGEELAIWQTLHHPNVVRLYGHITDAAKHVLLLELAQGGELFERIVSMQFFSEQLAARQVGEVLSALEYLHSFGVLHRDLKPENILLESADDDARVKIADFGASKLVITSGAKTPCGSLGYAAPEQLRGLKFAQDPNHVPSYDKEVPARNRILLVCQSGAFLPKGPFHVLNNSSRPICPPLSGGSLVGWRDHLHSLVRFHAVRSCIVLRREPATHRRARFPVRTLLRRLRPGP